MIDLFFIARPIRARLIEGCQMHCDSLTVLIYFICDALDLIKTFTPQSIERHDVDSS